MSGEAPWVLTFRGPILEAAALRLAPGGHTWNGRLRASGCESVTTGAYKNRV